MEGFITCDFSWGGGREGYSWELVVCCLFLQILTLFQTKKLSFMHSLKNHTEQNGAKTIPFGGHIPIRPIREYPPAPGFFLSSIQYFFIFKCTGYRLGDTEGGGSQPLPETVSSRNSGIQQENV